MAPSKHYLSCFSCFLGFLGVVLCGAGLAGAWSLGTRLTQTSDKLFEQVDASIVVVQAVVAESQERVQASKISTEEMEGILKGWTKKEVGKRLVERLEVEERAQQLGQGLRQAGQWLEVSSSTVQGIQQVLELSSTLGAPVDMTLVAPLQEKLRLLRSQLIQSTESLDSIRDRAAKIREGDTLEEQLRQIVQFTLRAAATLGEIDTRLEEADDWLLELQAEVQHRKTMTRRRIAMAIAVVLLLLLWMGAGQACLCRQGWRGFSHSFF